VFFNDSDYRDRKVELMNFRIEGLKGRLSLYWLLQMLGWSGYALDRYIQMPNNFSPVPFTYILIAFGLSLCLRPIYRRLWAGSPSVLTVGVVSLVCSAMAAFLWLLISQIIFRLGNFGPYPRNMSLPGYLSETFIYTLSHHKPFLFLSWSALYFGIKYWRERQEQEQRAMRATALAQEAELKMLRYQINPHFLFNSLNSASALVREDPARAERMLGELSEFLRYSLVQSKVTTVPLKEELKAVRSYLDIEKIRFEDKLEVRFDISSAAENFPVPSFLIHPLVENAVKYGMQTSALPLVIEVHAQSQNGTLRLAVVNSGRLMTKPRTGVPTSKGAGIGLDNVRQRLAQTFPTRHHFTVFERDGRVHAELEINRA
jgi:two-component system LytT family sensor kinase